MMKQHFITLQALRKEIAEFNPHGDQAVHTTLKALKMIKKALHSIEKEIHANGFPSVEDEITYFKEIKPALASYQISYALILNIEQMRYVHTDAELKKSIKNYGKFLKEHMNIHSEFVAYFNSKLSDRDHKYFLRENKCILPMNPLLSAQKLTTGYDVIAGYILAYRLFMDHFLNQNKNDKSSNRNTQVTWSKDKVAFVELISGLHAMRALQSEKMDLKTMTYELGAIFSIEIKDVYGKRKEIKARKGERFKFLRQMLIQLEDEFNNDDT